MTPTLRQFCDELAVQGLDDVDWRFESEDGPHLVLDAVSDDVGPLEVWDEVEELTLVFGRRYHCHFDGCESELPKPTRDLRLNAAAELAAEYVSRILTLRIGVAVHYRGESCIGASLIYLDDDGIRASDLAASSLGLYGGNVRTERFLWTGPIPSPERQDSG